MVMGYGVWLLLLTLEVVHSRNYEFCNRTFSGADPDGQIIYAGLGEVRGQDTNKPVNCWMLFEGEPGQIVVVKVTKLFTGEWNNTTSSCNGGRLIIYDGEKLYPDRYMPTQLCGRYNDQRKIMVKRVTSQNQCKVVFQVERAHSLVDFQTEVKFIYPDDEGSKDITVGYGNFFPKDKGRIKGTLCDFEIDAAECELSFGCHVLSPGYPGIYPPNVRCKYIIRQSKGKRVEVKLGGYKFRGKFDLKKSKGCTEDYIQIFEGEHTDGRMISRICGTSGEHFISSASSLLLEFVSGPGGPPWNYNGFNAQILSRWTLNFTASELVPETICDFKFSSENVGYGDFNTPDHQIPEGTTCRYMFQAQPDMSVQFEIVIFDLQEQCGDSLQIVEDNYVTKKFCDHNIKKRARNKFEYHSSGPNVTLLYIHKHGHISKSQPIFIDYKYVHGTKNLVTKDMVKYEPLPPPKWRPLVPIRPKDGGNGPPRDGYVNSASLIENPIRKAVTFSVLLTVLSLCS